MKEEEFFRSVYQADKIKLVSLLDNDKSLLSCKVPGNKLGWNSLHLSACLGHDAIVETLLDYGIDFGQLDNAGWSAAHLAILNDQLKVLKIILSAGESVNQLTRSHENLIFIAAKFNKPRILYYLATQGANLLTAANYQMQPNYVAASSGHLQCLKILLHSTFHRLESNQQEVITLFKVALANNQIHIADYLMQNYSIKLDWDKEDNFSKIVTVNLYITLCKLFYVENTKINELASTLDECLRQENISFLIAILRLIYNKCILPQISKFFESIVGKLVQITTPLQLVKTLLENCPLVALDLIKKITRAEVNILNIDGNKIPISWLAIENDDLELLKVIIDKYKNNNGILEVTDDSGNSILHFVVQKGAFRVLKYLLENQGLALNKINNLGQSLLHHAVEYNQETIVKLLLDQYRFDANSLDNALNTPLHTAAKCDNNLCAEILLSNGGANILAVNKEGKTALAIASERKNDRLVAKIKSLDKNLTFQSLSNKLSIPKITITVFEGGGVKGIGFYGALEKLTNEKIFDLSHLKIVAGTSAGAISAMLLAIGNNVDELGNILNGLNFFELIEENLRQLIFDIKAKLQKRNGLEEFIGPNIFKLINKIKNGKITDKDYIVSIAISFIAGKLPLGLLSKLSQKLGIHDQEFDKLKAEFLHLKEKIEPILAHFRSNHRGLFAGEILRKQFVKWIKEKNLDENLTFLKLHELALANNKYKDLYVVAYNSNERRTQIFSYEETPDVIIADAVRCSMSIQVFFEPHHMYINDKGVRRIKNRDLIYFDGGSLNNYILNLFDKKHFIILDDNQRSLLLDKDAKVTNEHAIGFRLVEPDLYRYYEENGNLPSYSDQGIINFLLSIVYSVLSFTVDKSNYILSPDEQKRTIHINTLDIGTVEFDISVERKEKLIQSGRNAAISFLNRFNKNSSIQSLTDLKYYFYSKSLSLEVNGIFLPTDGDEIFRAILNIARTLNVNEIKNALNRLGLDLTLIKDKYGNTLFHTAVQQGNLNLLRKLYQISQRVDIENNQGMMPLDSIVYCKDLTARQEILEFFTEQNIWYSKYLKEAKKSCNSSYEKCRYLLKITYSNNNKITKIANLDTLAQQASIVNLLELLANSSNVNWKKYSEDDLLSYVYMLVKQKKIELLRKLRLSIDQSDSQGMTVLHYFVLQSDKKNVSICLELLAFPNIKNHEDETPLDMVLGIESYSNEDKLYQQKIMVNLLLSNGAYRCKAKTKIFILNIYSNLDNTNSNYKLKESLEKFKNYDQSLSFDAEYKQFNLYRNFLEINQFSSIKNGYLTTSEQKNISQNMGNKEYANPSENLNKLFLSKDNDICEVLINTLGDGNCAFNALSLGICDLLVANKFPQNYDFDNRLAAQLKIEGQDNRANILLWLKTNTDLILRQRNIQIVLRAIAIDYINQNYDKFYASFYEELLWRAYQNYIIFEEEDDIFCFHTFILNMFKLQMNFEKNALIEWWRSIGKETYFNNLLQSARSLDDKERWGSEVEIGACVTYLQINIRWKKQLFELGQQLGIGGGLIEGLTDVQQKQLTDFGIGANYNGRFRLNSFVQRPDLEKRLNSFLYKKEILKLLNNTSDEYNYFPDIMPEIIDMGSLRRELIERNVITRENNGSYRFITQEGKIAREEIARRLDGLQDLELREYLLRSFNENVPEFGVLHRGTHWSYLQPSSLNLSKKSNTILKEKISLNPAGYKQQGLFSSRLASLQSAPINNLLKSMQKANISLKIDQNKDWVQIIFNDYKLVEEFSDELHKIGISNLGIKDAPRKTQVIIGKDGEEDKYIILLNSDEYNIIMDDEDAYAKLVSGQDQQLSFRP